MKRTSVTLAMGDETTFSFPVSGSNGYSWVRSVEGAADVISVSVAGLRDANAEWSRAPKASGGIQILTVRGVKPGNVSLHLEFKRSWVKEEAPVEEQWIDVEVIGT